MKVIHSIRQSIKATEKKDILLISNSSYKTFAIILILWLSEQCQQKIYCWQWVDKSLSPLSSCRNSEIQRWILTIFNPQLRGCKSSFAHRYGPTTVGTLFSTLRSWDIRPIPLSLILQSSTLASGYILEGSRKINTLIVLWWSLLSLWRVRGYESCFRLLIALCWIPYSRFPSYLCSHRGPQPCLLSPNCSRWPQVLFYYIVLGHLTQVS